MLLPPTTPCCPPLPHSSAFPAQFVTLGHALERQWGLRDQLTVKHTPAFISVVSRDTGDFLWQNAASMSLFGERLVRTGSLAATGGALSSSTHQPFLLYPPHPPHFHHLARAHPGCHGQLNSEARILNTSPADDLRRSAQSNLVGHGNFIEMVLGSDPVGGECGRKKVGMKCEEGAPTLCRPS